MFVLAQSSSAEAAQGFLLAFVFVAVQFVIAARFIRRRPTPDWTPQMKRMRIAAVVFAIWPPMGLMMQLIAHWVIRSGEARIAKANAALMGSARPAPSGANPFASQAPGSRTDAHPNPFGAPKPHDATTPNPFESGAERLTPPQGPGSQTGPQDRSNPFL